MQSEGDATLRTNLTPEDVNLIVARHGAVYAEEHGFDRTFATYVAGPLADCVHAGVPRERIWLAERDGEFAGCIAIVGVAETTAQLRWFLVEPSERGRGLGRRLLREAVAFSRERGYTTVTLWTVSALAAAAQLYEEAGFRKVEEVPGRQWGVDVVEERYELRLD